MTVHRSEGGERITHNIWYVVTAGKAAAVSNMDQRNEFVLQQIVDPPLTLTGDHIRRCLMPVLNGQM